MPRVGHYYAKLNFSVLNGCKWLKLAPSFKSDSGACTFMLGQAFSICKEWHLISAKLNFFKQLWRTYFDSISYVESNSSHTLIRPCSPSFKGSIVNGDKNLKIFKKNIYQAMTEK